MHLRTVSREIIEMTWSNLGRGGVVGMLTGHMVGQSVVEEAEPSRRRVARSRGVVRYRLSRIGDLESILSTVRSSAGSGGEPEAATRRRRR